MCIYYLYNNYPNNLQIAKYGDFLLKIQSKALGAPAKFLTEYEKEFLENLNTMDPNSAHYNISFEKGAYSFGPANSDAQSYYKEINKDKVKGDAFCGLDKKD